jgi:hypothetical protein
MIMVVHIHIMKNVTVRRSVIVCRLLNIVAINKGESFMSKAKVWTVPQKVTVFVNYPKPGVHQVVMRLEGNIEAEIVLGQFTSDRGAFAFAKKLKLEKYGC